MAEIESSDGNILTRKWGPLPVWGWGAIVLALAWGYAKYKSMKTASAITDTSATSPTDTGEPQGVAPQFIIENNQPAYNQPVTVPVAPTTPVVTPPGTSSAPPVATPTPAPPKSTAPAKSKSPVQYKVKSGDTLSSIAAKYRTSAEKLFTFNTTPGNRPAATIATLKSRGPNLIYAGETILIPQS